MKNKILEVKDLLIKFNNKLILDNVNFTLNQGAILGIVGPNGSGKTTLLSAISGILNINEGEILKPSNSNIGSLIDTPTFYNHLTGYENLKLIEKIRNISNLNTNILTVFDTVNLRAEMHKKFENYSYGMQQRLGIAGAICNNANLIILDEPTNGIDPIGIMEIRSIVKNLNQAGKTIIITSHNLNEIQQICTDLLILKNGKLLFNGLISSLLNANNQVEIASKDLQILNEKIVTMPMFINLDEQLDDRIVISVKNNTTLDAINKWCFEHDIVLSLLKNKKSDFESTIIDLL